jgi:hypothetical protein
MTNEILLCFAVWLAQLFLGSLLILGFQELVHARWLVNLEGELQQRLKTFFPVVIFFAALFLVREHLYEWTDPARIRGDFAKTYYNPIFFAGRSIFDFLVWGALWIGLIKKFRGIGPLTVIAVLFTGTQFGTDWVMSLDLHWKSTAFGLIFLLSGILTAFALALLQSPPPSSERELIDMGSVHFALIATWSYVLFMQFLVMWQGNLPNEATWYVARLHTSWKYLFLLILIFQFVVPLILLLMRKLKSSPFFMKLIALSTIVCQSLYCFLLVQPTLHPERISSPWVIVSFLALVALTIWILPRRATREQ